MRMSMDYSMAPAQVRQQFSMKDVRQYIAFHKIEREEREQAERDASLRQRAEQMRARAR